MRIHDLVTSIARRTPRLLGICFGLVSLALVASSPRDAGASWEYGVGYSEIFDPGSYSFASDPHGLASCSDRAGGMFVAMYDHTTTPSQVWISRILHNGTEAWGQGGIAVPPLANSLNQHSPVSVSPDGLGGAYVAYVEEFTSYEVFALSHFRADGNWDWTRPMDSPGTLGEYDALGLQLVASVGGEAMAAYTLRSPVPKLRVMRYDHNGSWSWLTDVNQSYSQDDYVSFGVHTTWEAVPDDWDGILITWLRMSVGTPEVGVQRLTNMGSRAWGDDGHMIWSGYGWGFHEPVATADGAYGAFVVFSQAGVARAQHVSWDGADAWPAGGIPVQDSGTPYTGQSTDPSICGDGQSGFLLVHGNQRLFAQRVDAAGNMVWGYGIAVGARAGEQAKADLATDGAGGAVLVWQDTYYTMPGQPWRVLVGTRLNGPGSPVWGPRDLYMMWNNYDPHDARVVSDGSGGALAAFPCVRVWGGGDAVWALGFLSNGAVGVETIPSPSAGPALAVAPNPCRAGTTISFSLSQPDRARLTIFDPQGRLIRTLAWARFAAGGHTAAWDGCDVTGRRAAPGIYLARLESEGTTEIHTHKIVVVP